jgi:tetratricopeptide (TPR) repeat protein
MLWRFTQHWLMLVCSACIVLGFPLLAATQSTPRVPEQTQKGERLLSQGQWEEAMKEFHASLQIEPNRPDTHANLGMAYYFNGDSASAIPEFQEALRLDQDRVDALHGLGLALYDQGDFAGAITAFRSSSQQNPVAYYNLGNALEQKGEYGEALEAYKQYLSSTPPSPETALLENAVRKNVFPTPAAGTALDHFRRGQSLLEKKDATGAISAFLFALRLKPNYVDASNHLGLAFRAAGNLEEAIAAYQTAIRLNVKFSTAYRNLAQAFEEKGDRSAAALGYDRYLLLAPSATDAAEIRAKIAQLRGGQ